MSSFDLRECQNQVTAPPVTAPTILTFIYILVQRKRIWEAPSSLSANNPTVDAIQNIIKQIPAHIKIGAKFLFSNAINCSGVRTSATQ